MLYHNNKIRPGVIKNVIGMFDAMRCHRLDNLSVWLAGNQKFQLSFNEGSTSNCHYCFVIYDNLIILSEMKIM